MTLENVSVSFFIPWLSPVYTWKQRYLKWKRRRMGNGTSLVFMQLTLTREICHSSQVSSLVPR